LLSDDHLTWLYCKGLNFYSIYEPSMITTSKMQAVLMRFETANNRPGQRPARCDPRATFEIF